MMREEAVVKLAIKPAYAEVGSSTSKKLPVHRSKLIADLADYVEADIARQYGAQAMDVLRDSGWTVFHAKCERFTFTATAYKVPDGLSYYAELPGAVREVHVSVVLRCARRIRASPHRTCSPTARRRWRQARRAWRRIPPGAPMECRSYSTSSARSRMALQTPRAS